jgi:hypothetical protein
MTEPTTTTTNTSTSPTASPSMPSSATASAGGEESAGRVSRVAETGQREAGRVVDEARTHTARLIGETGDRARDHADQQLGRAAGAIGQLGDELEDMASSTSHPDSYVAALARDGAHGAHQLSERLQRGGLDGVIDDVTRFARRRPGTFLAGSFAVGILLGRVTRNADLDRLKQDLTENGPPPQNTSASTGPEIRV